MTGVITYVSAVILVYFVALNAVYMTTSLLAFLHLKKYVRRLESLHIRDLVNAAGGIPITLVVLFCLENNAPRICSGCRLRPLCGATAERTVGFRGRQHQSLIRPRSDFGHRCRQHAFVTAHPFKPYLARTSSFTLHLLP